MSAKEIVRPRMYAPFEEEERIEDLRTKKIIMIVDDDPGNVETLQDIMEAKGYSTLVAYDGVQVLHTIDALKSKYDLLPDFILMDIRMPYLDGFETCKRLKSIEAYSRIPVCFVSAYSPYDSKTVREESGAVGFIDKPANFEAIFKLIEKTLG